MKKFMLLSGTSGAGILLLGNFFKFMHWPGASAFLLLGILLLSLIFLPLLFFIKIKEKPSNGQIWLLSVGTLLAVAFCLSVLFKLMHWPLANILGNISLFGAVLVFTPLYLVNSFKSNEQKTNAIVTVILIIASAGMLYSLTVTRMTRSLQEGPWLVLEQNEKSNAQFNNYCLRQLGSDSSEHGKQKMEKFVGLNQKATALKNYLFQGMVPGKGNLNVEELINNNPNDLVTSKLLPTDESQTKELIEFEESLNRIYGDKSRDLVWAKNHLFGMRHSEIFMLINDIEKEAALYLLLEQK